jgi:hypothetical protein
VPLALTLVDHIGIYAGILIFVLGLILILRPFKIHVSIRHENDRSADEKEKKP